ncbi:MAG TPA: ABC transporter permease [Candidatus Limnocylindrales bacterium]
MNAIRGYWARIRPIVAVPLGAVILALVVGGLVALGSSFFTEGGFDPTLPFKVYLGLFGGAFFGLDHIVNTLVNAMPLVLAGLGVGLGFKAGLFNIGAQGQFLLGAVAAGGVGAAVASWPGPVAIAVAVLAAAAAGAFWGFIPGALKAWTGAHEVVITIMLNFVSASLVAFLVLHVLEAPGYSFARTGDIGNAALPTAAFLNPDLGRLHIGIVLAILFVPLAWWLLYRTTIGFEIRTVGANPDAARYAGMRPARLIILTMTVSGLLCGVAAAFEILGTSQYMIASYGTSVGFDSIAVALLGRSNPVGILLAALLFGALRAGAGPMQLDAHIPVELVDVIQAVILLFLAADMIVRRILRIRRAKPGLEAVETVTETYGKKVVL